MPNPIHVVPGKQPNKILNKEQKRFNSLVKKINTLQEKITQVKALDLELRKIGAERIKPVEDKAKNAFREWLMALHKHPAKAKLSQKMADKFGQMMESEIAGLLETELFSADTELQEMYVFYEASGRSYEELQRENEQEEKLMAAEMMHMMFGIDIDPDEMDDPEKFMEKMDAKQAEFERAEEEKRERKKHRKKNPSAIITEEKQQAVQASVKKTVKELYLNLVRHFHPDKEPDEKKREEKTEIMKQITEAFKSDDHLRLLELQMNLLSDSDSIVSSFDNAHLKYFNQTLQQQVAELDNELFMSSPDGNGNLYAQLYSENRRIMLQNIERHIRINKDSIKDIQGNLRIIREETVFKSYVRDYEFDYF